MAMANSVEGRFPFLDHRVMEFCNRLPLFYKLRGLNEKYLLKLAFAEELPQEVIQRPKQPYRAPICRSFFAENTPDYVEALLGEESLRKTGYFEPNAVRSLVRKCKQPTAFVSEVENMALAFILSVQLLDELFFGRPPTEDPDPDPVPFSLFAPAEKRGNLRRTEESRPDCQTPR
jgi:asparagine synthase (glutamine-hydrolysing)